MGFIGACGEQRGITMQVALGVIQNVPFWSRPTVRGVEPCVRVFALYQDAPSNDIGVAQVADADGEPGLRPGVGHGTDRVDRTFVAPVYNAAAPGPLREVIAQFEHPGKGSR